MASIKPFLVADNDQPVRVALSPKLRAEILRRIHEMETRGVAITPLERRELTGLRQLATIAERVSEH